MSKDKGSKNVKKAPADKSLGRAKPISAYKSEGKSDTVILPVKSYVEKHEKAINNFPE
ncbi:MAG: hypothetical protein IPL95_19275 [Saprospiraceae bacterium]|nr:hypothetical protein [Saprospiraceae bacterium]